MKFGITACSNSLKLTDLENIYTIKNILNDIGIDVELSTYLFENDGNSMQSAELKAENLMRFYQDDTITHIADVSGGDTANEILQLLDFDIIKDNPKIFMGYSDLTVILNAINSQTDNIGYLYTIRNLIRENSKNQIADFENSIINGSNELFNLNYSFLRGDNLRGTLIGGNIRCLSKLFGTKYSPNFKDKILLLESLGGGVNQIKSLINQYLQVGVFNQIKGVVLGTFSNMEENHITPTVEDLILNLTKDIPIVKTYDIGHGANSKCVKIGSYYEF